MNPICEVEFDWNKSFTPLEQKMLEELSDRPIKWEDAKDAKAPENKKLDYSNRAFVVPLEDALRFGEVTVKRIITKGVAGQLQAIIEHLRNLNPQPAFNERVSVSVPGNGLLNINKLDLIEDCCTDIAQGKLNDGWRIVAICPQPNQRRPDFIFGKFVPGEA